MGWITALGLLAATCTTISFVPQAIKTIRTRSTKDISLLMYSILVLGTFLWLLYGIIIEDWPVILANAITVSFSATILINKIRFG